MTLKAVYDTSTGVLVSVGSVVADPLPAGLSVLDLGTDDRLLTGYGFWDTATRTVVAVVPSPAEAEAAREATRVLVKAIITDLQAEKDRCDVVIAKTNNQVSGADTKDVARAAKRIADAAIELARFVQDN